MRIRPFLGAEADPTELRQRYTLYKSDRLSAFPGFPVHSCEQYAANALRPSRSDGLVLDWSAWEGERLVGSAGVSLVDQDGTLVAVPRVDVAPDRRCRGIGTALLRQLVAAAKAGGCGTLVADAVRIGSDGSRWAECVGFRTAQVFSWQMLQAGDVDRALWQVPVPAGYRLEHWAAAAPERWVAAFAEARNAIADSPLGETSLVHPTWTVERIRRTEAEIAADGDECRVVVAVHERSGAVAAFTELLLDPVLPALSWQRDTAVTRAHRGLGLGRAVKAAMLRRLTAEVPGLDRVITSTAASNATMRRVNERVGYLPYAEIGMLEAATADIEAALRVPGARSPYERRAAPLFEGLTDFEA